MNTKRGADSNNVAVGHFAGQNVNGSSNVFIGHYSGGASSQNTISGNVIIAPRSNALAYDGSHSVIIGADAGAATGLGANANAVVIGRQAYADGGKAVIIGPEAAGKGIVLGDDTEGGNNSDIVIGIGGGTGRRTGATSSAILMGYNVGNGQTGSCIVIGTTNAAGKGSAAGLSGTIVIGNGGGSASDTDSIFIGDASGSSSSGQRNVFLGRRSGNETSGSYNVMIGDSAGYGDGSGTAGSNNVYIGASSGVGKTENHRLRIDTNSSANTNNTPLIYGEFDNDFLKVNGDLEVTGSDGLILTSPNGTRYKVTVTDAGALSVATA